MSETTDQRTHWHALVEELDAWQAEGRVAELWWRDDDASVPGPKLERLFELTTSTGLLLATIPARASTELVSEVSVTPHVWVGQHGYSHTNHAPKGQGAGAWELGLHRGLAATLADLDLGRSLLEQLFADRFLPVVIPPWNRIDSSLLPIIAERGYAGVSLFGARTVSRFSPSCVLVNAHCDPIKWKSGPRFAGEAKSLEQFTEHLRQRRSGQVDAQEPTGVLTHHRDLDADGWAFCANLVNLVNAHSAARWRTAAELFPEAR